MARSTIGTKLLISQDGSVWNHEVKIDSFPDIGGSPEQIDVTTLVDRVKKYINGVQEQETMEFSTFLKDDMSDYDELKALEDRELHYQVVIGATGKSAFFDGKHTLKLNGGGVNEALKMTITIAPSTDPEIDTTQE